jgi:hypothetical protein
MGAYTLIGESILNHHASKYLQMACFYNQSTLRLRFFDKTSDAYERCLNEEFAMKTCLCDQPKQFILHDYHDQIHLNLDLELSTTSRINIGYKQIPLTSFWLNHIDRSCFIFPLPNYEGMKTFAVHVDVYQPMLLESALHTRLFINTLNVRRRRYHFGVYEKCFTLVSTECNVITTSSVWKIIGENGGVISKSIDFKFKHFIEDYRKSFDKKYVNYSIHQLH